MGSITSTHNRSHTVPTSLKQSHLAFQISLEIREIQHTKAEMSGFVPPQGSGQSKAKGGKSSSNSDNHSLKTLNSNGADSKASIKGQAGSRAASVKSSKSGGSSSGKK